MLFHARVMFPFRDADGRVLGFAGLATHLGPSWPLWLTSPDRDQFRTSAAIFAMGRQRLRSRVQDERSSSETRFRCLRFIRAAAVTPSR